MHETHTLTLCTRYHAKRPFSQTEKKCFYNYNTKSAAKDSVNTEKLKRSDGKKQRDDYNSLRVVLFITLFTMLRVSDVHPVCPPNQQLSQSVLFYLFTATSQWFLLLCAHKRTLRAREPSGAARSQ